VETVGAIILVETLTLLSIVAIQVTKLVLEPRVVLEVLHDPGESIRVRITLALAK
jgi:hypothetical protein